MELTSPVKSTLGEYAGLALHICVSALIFAILMLPIVGLGALGNSLVRMDVSSRFVTYALKSGAYMLFFVNTIAFFVNIVAQTVRTLRRTWRCDVQDSSRKSAETQRRWQAIGLGVTATIAVMVSTGYLVASYINPDSAGLIYETVANKSRTETLEDGTLVTLGAQSRLQVNYTAKRRSVHLLGGEAMFEVAQDTARPFVVSTFLVDLTGGRKFGVVVDTTVTVTVHEGLLKVSGRGATQGSPGITLKGGNSYRVPVDEFRAVVASDGVNVAQLHRSHS